MSNDYLQVEGHPGLVRDKKTKAIINTDVAAYKQAQERKRKFLEKEQKIKNLENDVQEIKNTMNKILDHLEKNK